MKTPAIEKIAAKQLAHPEQTWPLMCDAQGHMGFKKSDYPGLRIGSPCPWPRGCTGKMTGR